MEKKDDGLDIFREMKDALGVGKHFEDEVIDAFEKSLDIMEESDSKFKGVKEAYTNTLIEIMKAPQEAQGLILIALMYKCLHVDEVPQIIEQEKEFMTMYTLDKLSKSDNPIAKLTMIALKAGSGKK
jgi:hypothetical protein